MTKQVKKRADKPTSIRILPPELKVRAIKKAKEKRWSLGNLICFLLEEYLKEK